MNMNEHSKQQRKHGRGLGAVEREVLEQLSFGDMLFGYLLSAGSTGRMFKLARERATYCYRRKRAIARLMELEFIHRSGQKLSLTDAGNNALGKTVEKTRALLNKKHWDGKWRVAIFDIPQKYSPLRRKVRDVLKRAGFIQLQQSVWIFPHESEDLVKLIKKESQLAQFILYGVLERIENEKRLLKLFRLGT